MLINGGEQRLNISRKCEVPNLLVRQHLNHLNPLLTHRMVPRPHVAQGLQVRRGQLHTSADIVTCDNPLWADKVKEVSPGAVQ